VNLGSVNPKVGHIDDFAVFYCQISGPESF